MQVIVLSDTHIPRRAKKLPVKLINALPKADLIIHAGDWQTDEIYKEISQYGKVIGVTGNVDSPELNRQLNQREMVEVNGFRIGVVHGHGKGQSTEKRAVAAFSGEEVDCIIFGHSHIPLLKKVGGITLFNPGSATDKRRQKRFSYGMINLASGEPQFRHIFYDSKD